MSLMKKKVLVSGLGRFISSDPQAQERSAGFPQALQENFEKAREAGYEMQSVDVNPADPEGSLQRIGDELRRQHYDAYIIGFGLRGNKAFTPLFERIVNLCREVSPTTTFGFSPAPDEAMATIQRVLPVESDE